MTWQSMDKQKLISNLSIIYFIVGLIFALSFAIYYKWQGLALLSPGFFSVVFTWPIQVPGMVSDLLYYGLAGKPI